MTVRILVLSDTHIAREKPAGGGARHTHLGAILLLRAIKRIERFLRPDAVLFLGDLTDTGDAESLAGGAEIFGHLSCPMLVLPGNHDGAPETFFRHLPPPPPFLDLAGGAVRILPFVDEQTEGYNARRSRADLERLRTCGRADGRTVIACQHVPLFDPALELSPYNYDNAREVIGAMRAAGVRCALSGHYHPGYEAEDASFGQTIAAPALCEGEGAFLELIVNGDAPVAVRHHRLALPRAWELVDTHVHTRFAYCAENMDFAKTCELAELFGLGGFVFAEHGGHLYFPSEEYGSGRCMEMPLPRETDAAFRLGDYFCQARACASPRVRVGLEVDCAWDGRPLARSADMERADWILGAMHHLPPEAAGDAKAAEEAFRFMLERFVRSCPMRTLAHPFRLFRRAGLPTPTALYPCVARLLKENGIAAEINYHTNDPDDAFLAVCLEEGVPLTLGSDAHNLYEVGELYPHLEQLRRLGVAGDPRDVLRPV